MYLIIFVLLMKIQKERDDLYSKFVKAIHEVQQKTGFKNLLLEKKLTALADTLEKKVLNIIEGIEPVILLCINTGSSVE